MNQKLKIEKGFTLVEILLVVVIITVLAAMVVPNLAGRGEDARKSAARADIEANLSMALDMYELDNGRYPTTSQGLEALLSKPSSSPTPKNWNGPYLETEPLDPWKIEYAFKSPGANNTSSYDLYSFGPDGIENNKDDIKNWE